MAQESFKAKAYLRVGCPYSFKFLLFMAEARLLDQIDVIRCDPRGPSFESIKAKLAAGLDKPARSRRSRSNPGATGRTRISSSSITRRKTMWR
jgi:hypothetical protein